VPHGDWVAIELWVAAWGILVWRVLVNSVTLTRDTLVIRNIFSTRQVPLADVTGVGFRRGGLKVTSGHGSVADKRYTVGVGNLGSTYYSGLRSDPDALAEAIAYAAGLPPPPPRREIVSRNWAWAALAVSVTCTGLGICYGCAQIMADSHSLALGEAAAVLYGLGTGTLGLAFRVTRDHRRKRAQPAAARSRW